MGRVPFFLMLRISICYILSIFAIRKLRWCRCFFSHIFITAPRYHNPCDMIIRVSIWTQVFLVLVWCSACCIMLALTSIMWAEMHLVMPTPLLQESRKWSLAIVCLLKNLKINEQLLLPHNRQFSHFFGSVSLWDLFFWYFSQLIWQVWAGHGPGAAYQLHPPPLPRGCVPHGPRVHHHLIGRPVLLLPECGLGLHLWCRHWEWEVPTHGLGSFYLGNSGPPGLPQHLPGAALLPTCSRLHNPPPHLAEYHYGSQWEPPFPAPASPPHSLWHGTLWRAPCLLLPGCGV